jgi:WD40 repeat protein
MNRRIIVRIIISIFVLILFMWLFSWYPVKAWNYEENQTALAISLDTQLVATASRSSKDENAVVKLRNLTDGSIVRTLEIPGHYVSSIAFSPNGSLIATVNNLGQVQVWRINNGQLLYIREFKKNYQMSVVFSPDSSLITVSNQVQIQVWRADNGQLLYTRELPVYPYKLAFSPDGKTLVLGLSQPRTKIEGLDNAPKIEVWNAIDGKHHYTLLSKDWQYSISPNGKLIAIGNYWTPIRLYQLSDGSFVRQLEVKGYPQFSPDSQLLAISFGTIDLKEVILYRLKDDQFLDSFSTSKELNSIVFSPDGKFIVVSYYTGGSGSSDITVWSSSPKRGWSYLTVWRLVPFEGKYFLVQAAKIKSKKDSYYPLAFTPDSKFLLTRLWLLGSGVVAVLIYNQRALLLNWFRF